jgi:hypothetical protein
MSSAPTTDFQGLDGPALFVVSYGRAAVGAAAYLAPAPLRAFCGLHGALGGASGHTLDTCTRLFGVRDVALGAAMSSKNVEARRIAVTAALFVDAMDALATGLQYFRGELSDRAGVLVFAGAAAFAGLNAYLLYRHQKLSKGARSL